MDTLLGNGESNRLGPPPFATTRALAHTVGSYFPLTACEGYLAAYAGVVPDAVDTALADHPLRVGYQPSLLASQFLA